jgi:hypothetical protein
MSEASGQPLQQPDQAASEPAPVPGPLDFLFQRRTAAVLSLALLLLVLAFGSKDRRDSAVDFIEDDLKAPVAKVAPFEVADHFLESLRDCDALDRLQGRLGGESGCVGFPGWVGRIPTAIVDTADYVISQGLLAVLLIGIPVALFFLALIAGLKEGEGLPIVLYPPAWAGLVILPAVFVWLVQLVILALLFVVEQTILAVGIIAVAYVIYEKLDLWHKMSSLLHEIFRGTQPA